MKEAPLLAGTASLLSRVPAGFPSPADDYVEKRVDLNFELIKHPAATFLIRVSGHSMVGAGIFDGDTLLVDRSLEGRSGKIVLAAIDGEFTVKRLRVRKGVASLVAEAEGYPEVVLTEEGRIWGVVTWVLHKV